MADDNTGAGRSDWLPRPDPTALTTAQLLRELSSLREVLDTRLDAMDKATALLADTVNRTPTEIEKQISRLRELTDERFSSIDKQFAERDVRTEQAAKASKEALDAALLAAKELVSQQNEANAAAADKALELIADGGIAKVRKGVYRVTSSDGESTYLTSVTGSCNCPHGLRAKTVARCYHVAAVRLPARPAIRRASDASSVI